MSNHIRRQQMVEEVNRACSVTVEQLAVKYNISVETVRRDLAWLEKMGRLVRVHGGARTLQQADLGELFKKRRNEHTVAKILWHAKRCH